MKYLKDIELYIHETPEQLYLAFCPDIDHTHINDTEMDLEFNLSRKESINLIKKNRFWGFVDLNSKAIHVWADPKVEFEHLLKFFGHEFGHFMQDSRKYTGEKFAQTYSDVVEASYQSACYLMEVLEQEDSNPLFGSEIRGLIYEASE